MLPNICVPVKRDAWSGEVTLPHKSPSIWNILSFLMRCERERETGWTHVLGTLTGSDGLEGGGGTWGLQFKEIFVLVMA